MHSKSFTNPTGATDLKKIFNSHIQENKYLQKQKIFLDEEKLRAFKNLSYEEANFLRKYEKYVSRSSARRRESIDANLLRQAEANLDRDVSSAQKSFDRDTVNNECPYSLNTWNTLVDVDSNILQSYKNAILRAADGDISENISENNYPASVCNDKQSHEKTLEDYKDFTEDVSEKDFSSGSCNSVSVISAEDTNFNNSEMNSKRHSLTPIDKSLLSKLRVSDGENIQVLELDFQHANLYNNKPRRHSVTPGMTPSVRVQRRRQSVDGSIKLPRITESLHSKQPKEIRRKMSKSDQDVSTSDPNANTFEKHQIVPSVLVTDYNSENNPSGSKTNESFPTSPRLKPNAAIFVREDTGISVRKDNINLDIQVTNNNQVRDTNDSDINEARKHSTESFLPVISRSNTLLNSPNHDYLDTPPMRDRSVSFSSISSAKSTGKSPASRRSSMSTTALSLLVENTKGAARLRYIALLATEMEKEEREKLNLPSSEHTPSPDLKDPITAVQNCRYLRVANQDSSENVDSIF